MKKFVLLIAIVVAFYSYSSKANEIVGKGLVCIEDSIDNKRIKTWYPVVVGMYFINNTQYELWYNIFALGKSMYVSVIYLRHRNHH